MIRIRQAYGLADLGSRERSAKQQLTGLFQLPAYDNGLRRPLHMIAKMRQVMRAAATDNGGQIVDAQSQVLAFVHMKEKAAEFLRMTRGRRDVASQLRPKTRSRSEAKPAWYRLQNTNCR